MIVTYNYWFRGEPTLPDYVRGVARWPGVACLAIDPVSRFTASGLRPFRDFGEMSRKFWDQLLAGEIKGSWYCVPEFGACESRFHSRDFRQAELFALNTTDLLGIEGEPPVDPGCRMCGHGRRLTDEPFIDEVTTIFCERGFTDCGRWVVDVAHYRQMVDAGITGFHPVPVACRRPDDFVVRLIATLKRAIEDLRDFPGKMPEGVVEEHWGDDLALFVPPEVVASGAFAELDRYLREDLAERDRSGYHLIAPAQEVGLARKARWVALEVTGVAGTELGVNEYIKEVICPLCGKGGHCPAGQLRVNTSTWDGSDICATESGRLCVSKKAYRMLKKWLGDWMIAEPIVSV